MVIVGIDLGTTNSCISVWKDNNPYIIKNIKGDRTVPSVVSFTKTTKYVGKSAKNQIELNPENSYYDVKRIIGKQYDDPTVQQDIPFLSYSIKDIDGDIKLVSTVEGRKELYAPEEISAMILQELKYSAEAYLKTYITEAVVTVPAYFNDSQRQATKDAATIAGLNCVRIVNEPTAASLAYGLEKMSEINDINVIVYDLGGGTLDVSLLNISHGVFEVEASTGNSHLGGSDFDNKLVTYCMNKFKKKHSISKLDGLSSVSYQKLRKSCENCKKKLSTTWKTVVAVENFYDSKNLHITVTRNQFEDMCRDLFLMCLKPVDDVLESCGMSKDDINEIILVGGCTRMPTIRENLKRFFNGKEPNTSVNPDEVVAAGAAVQGHILANKDDPFSENVVLLDIVPLSFGVETIGGVMDVVVPRNSAIPIKRKKKFTTDTDYETSVKIKIFEGVREMTKDNFMVGEFTLEGLEKAQRGVPEIDITFDIDINGIISVTAEDCKNSQNSNCITVTDNKGRLSKDEIDVLVQEAKKMEVKDKSERFKKQMYYEIEDICSSIKINLQKISKLSEKYIDGVNKDINDAMTVLENNSYLDIDKNNYIQILEKLRKKYSTLILKMDDNSDVKAVSTTENTATTVFEDEEDETTLAKIDSDEDDDSREELVQLRDSLVQLCYTVFDVLKLVNCDVTSVKDFIDDTLLWVHVEDKISVSEYKNRTDTINNMCEKVVDEYGEDIFSNSVSCKDELENLCCTVKCFTENNNVDELDKKVESVLNWLDDICIETRKAELVDAQYTVDDVEYKKRFDELSEMFKMYNVDEVRLTQVSNSVSGTPVNLLVKNSLSKCDN